jgi:hypothetical protein
VIELHIDPAEDTERRRGAEELIERVLASAVMAYKPV